MTKCVNVNHPQFLQLVEETGINPIVLSAKMGVWMENNNTDEWPSVRQLGISSIKPIGDIDNTQYQFKAINILLSDRAKQIFDKGKKANWTLDKILIELAIPKEQREILLGLGINGREELAIQLASSYGFVVSIETATNRTSNINEWTGGVNELIPLSVPFPSSYYANLTQPGGINYTENRIITPNITPSIKGHPQFAEDNDIGWFRSDEQVSNDSVGNWEDMEPLNSVPSNVRRILEIQSDLFQKGRDRSNLIDKKPDESKDLVEQTPFEDTWQVVNSIIGVIEGGFKSKEEAEKWLKTPDTNTKNQFLQLLNKDNNWVTFFIKSIIQDSVKKGYGKVLFPRGETAAKIEGHETITDEIRRINIDIDKIKTEGKSVKYQVIDETGAFRAEFTKIEEAENYLADNDIDGNIDYFSEDLRTLEKRKQELKEIGIEKLKPIEAFYEIRITNTLKKLYPTNNIVDEYGNEWTEVTITPQIASEIIQLQKNSDIFGTPIDIKNPITQQNIDKQTSNLKEAFAKVGINVEVTPNENIEESARVTNGKIEYNPYKLRDDSIFHEYAHILVDLIADRDFINSGIEQLRGTELWNKIATLYSDLSDEQLGKEVLTTAIGLEARNQFNSTNVKGWQFWYNRFKDRVVDLLNRIGITITRNSPVENKNIYNSVVTDLAKQLTTGNITMRLNRELEIHDNQLRLEATNELINNANTFLETKFNQIMFIFNKYKHNPNSTKFFERTSDTKSVIENLGIVNERNLINTYKGLNNVIKYDYANLTNLETRVNNLIKQYVVSKDSLIGKSIEEYKEFSETIYSTYSFLKSLTPIKNFATLSADDIAGISEADREQYSRINEMIFKTQREMLPRIATLEGELARLLPLNTEYILQFTTNPKLKEDIGKFLEEWEHSDMDETKMQLVFDAMLDSNNILGANLAKIMRVYEGKAIREAQEVTQTYWKARNQLTDYTSKQLGGLLYDKYGQLRKEFEYERFYEDLDAVLAKHKYGTSAYYSARNKFYNQNSEMRFKPDGTRYTQADILLITADKEATLSKLDYEEWYEKNLGKDGSHQKVTGMFKQPIAKYKDSVYASIKHGNNSALSNFYDVLYDIQTTSSRYYKYLPQGDGFLPNIVDHPTKRGIEHGEEVELLGLDGEIVHQIPFKYIGLLNAKREIYYRGRKYDSLTDTYEDFDTYEQEILKSLLDRGIIQPNQFKSLDEISTYNKTLRKANKEAHGDAVSRDLDKVMPLFITSSTDYKYKNLIESGILLALAELKHQKVTKLNGFGRPIYSNEVDREGNKKLATYEGDSNTYKHANKMVEMIFYDKFLKKGSGDAFLKGLKDYSSVIGMGFNAFAGVKNITYGGFMTAAEATSGRFFTLSDIATANQDYFSNSMSYLSDITGKEDGATSNEVNGLFHMFNIIESYDEMFELQDSEVSKRFAREMFINTAFAMQHAGEHMMHNMTLLAMLNSHRLYKGKAITINEYLDGKLQVVTPEMIDDNTAYEKVLEHNTQVKATAKEEFEKLPKLRDMFEHVDGYSKIKEEYKDKFSTEEYILFREKVRGVNHLMHGIYNKQDRGTIENKMIGQNLLQFRKWARKGWNKRFGTRGGIMSHQEFWNERVNTNDIGDYKALWKLITKPSTKSGNVFRNAEEKGAYQAISNMLGDYLQAIVRAKFYWNTMTENEKEGIRRAGVELLELAIVFTLSRLLAAAIPDDKKHNRLINFMLYQLSASQTELAAYTPIYGWFNESAKIVANPTATYGLMVNSYKLAKQAFMYPFVSDEKNHFQGGYYNDRLKVEVYAGRMIPGYNVFLRIQALDSQKTAYKLY